MEEPIVFLDANVLFSAALGGEVFNAIWAVAVHGRYRLATSLYCFLEAQKNLSYKRPEALKALEERMLWVTLVPEAAPEPWMRDLVPEKDLPVLAAAVAAGARVLLTGDTRHFGGLRGEGAPSLREHSLPLGVMTPADFIRNFRP